MNKKIIYICAVIQLQGIRKKPFESGEVVVPSNFPAEHFEKLIASGHIKEKTEKSEDDATQREDYEAKAKSDAESEEAAKGKNGKK